MMQCPMGKALVDCPLEFARESFSVEDRMRMVCQLHEDIIDSIIGYHIECLFEREKML